MRILSSVGMSLLLLVFPIADAYAVTPAEYATVLNLSGRQRMLTQKMSKEAFLVAANVDAEQNRASLAQTTALFDKTLKGLKEGNASMGLPATTNASTLKMLARVEKRWQTFKGHMDAVAQGAEVPVADVASLNPPLLKDMNTVVRLYEKSAKREAGLDAGVVINLAGKQRMLTQKMSKEALLVFLGHDAAANRGNVRATADLFERTLSGLRDGDANLELPGTQDPNILAQLDKVSNLWTDFKPVVNKASDADTTLSSGELDTLATLNLPLLREMNTAVSMYEKQQQ